MRGETARGLIIGLTIGLLWLGGLLIGGLGVINRDSHPAWFIGQALAAPSVLANHIRRGMESPDQLEPAEARDTYAPSFGRVQDQGILYTSLAGLLNLLAILDVLYREPGYRRRDRAAPDHALEAGR